VRQKVAPAVVADLVLAEEPSIDFDGYMTWRARNDGTQLVSANTSMGDYDIRDRQTDEIKGARPHVAAQRLPAAWR
jgi:hypothetical protein